MKHNGIFINFKGVELNAAHIATLTQEQWVKESKGNQFVRFADKETDTQIEAYKACKEAVKNAPAETPEPDAKASGKADGKK